MKIIEALQNWRMTFIVSKFRFLLTAESVTYFSPNIGESPCPPSYNRFPWYFWVIKLFESLCYARGMKKFHRVRFNSERYWSSELAQHEWHNESNILDDKFALCSRLCWKGSVSRCIRLLICCYRLSDLNYNYRWMCKHDLLELEVLSVICGNVTVRVELWTHQQWDVERRADVCGWR